MPIFTFSPGLCYELHYTDNRVVTARFDTTIKGVPIFQTGDGDILSYNEAIRNLDYKIELPNQ